MNKSFISYFVTVEEVGEEEAAAIDQSNRVLMKWLALLMMTAVTLLLIIGNVYTWTIPFIVFYKSPILLIIITAFIHIFIILNISLVYKMGKKYKGFQSTQPIFAIHRVILIALVGAVIAFIVKEILQLQQTMLPTIAAGVSYEGLVLYRISQLAIIFIFLLTMLKKFKLL